MGPKKLINHYDHGIVATINELTKDEKTYYSWEVKQYEKHFQSGHRDSQAEALAVCESCVVALLMDPPSGSLGAWSESGPQCWVKDKMVVTRFHDSVLSTVNIHASVTMHGSIDKVREGMDLAEAMQARWLKAVPKMREAFEKEAEKYGFKLFVPSPQDDSGVSDTDNDAVEGEKGGDVA